MVNLDISAWPDHVLQCTLEVLAMRALVDDAHSCSEILTQGNGRNTKYCRPLQKAGWLTSDHSTGNPLQLLCHIACHVLE